MARSEFDLIRQYLTGLGCRREDVQLGVGDDAALLQPPAGHLLAVSTDTLVAGVHFPEDAPVAAIGHKALAVNLSDLAAMAAEPAWTTLCLTMPSADGDWLQAFATAFDALAREHGVALVGGDLCRGPLVITVQITGFVPAGRALRRDGATPGDHVVVSGCLGDAALGLRCWQAGERGSDTSSLTRRLHRPSPRIQLGLALRGRASAAIDLSDGLASDLGHVLTASGCGAEIQVQDLPCSETAVRYAGAVAARQAALAGGDDYELCFTVPERFLPDLAGIAGAVGTPLTVIGRIVAEPGLRLRREDGSLVPAAPGGYQHFGEE
ncbi:thiamine-phosphate kinase [Methylonatrum kenyense]|uniref:thiamine-phosphate kinase n=1 Tax=Methylonatrum kenyense TaxID=455253 RepID=UPI0020BD76DE|nr:thiamine-phosphate kinase [Methylonatrum kenyense]MCK8517309.1 thiamine-phosphate kinase [Methylonatrum kenyense]